MDDHEAELMKDIERRRAELLGRAEAFRRNLITNFDPREKVKRHPLAGLATSLLAGVALALASPRRPDRQVAASANGLMGAFLPGLLKGIVPTLLMGLVNPLLAGMNRKNTPDPSTNRHDPQA